MKNLSGTWSILIVLLVVSAFLIAFAIGGVWFAGAVCMGAFLICSGIVFCHALWTGARKLFQEDQNSN